MGSVNSFTPSNTLQNMKWPISLKLNVSRLYRAKVHLDRSLLSAGKIILKFDGVEHFVFKPALAPFERGEL